MKYVYIANRADVYMITVIGKFPDDKINGMVLGYRHEEDEEVEVLEAIDSGFRGIPEKSSFPWDVEYVDHLKDLFSGFFYPPLEVVGVWHKYNHDCDQPFSEEDKELHRKMLQTCKNSIVAIVFQKVREDEYRKRAFIIDQTGSYKEVDIID